MRRPAAAGQLAIDGDVLLLARDARRREVDAGEAAEELRRHPPGHCVKGEIGERVAGCREFPIEHADHPRLGRVEDQIVDAVVAVDDARRAFRRQVARQPLDQPVHCRLGLGLRGLVLPAPARDLAR